MTDRSRSAPLRSLLVASLGVTVLATGACSPPAAGPSTSSTAGSAASSAASAAAGSPSVLPLSTSNAGASSNSGSATSGEPAYVAGLQPRIDQLVRELSITGAAVLVRSPELGDWSTTIGTRTWHGTDPVTPADHIRIGSNTKPMTGTVILQLVDEGKIGLEDPVSKYRPDVPNGDNITITQLLNMRSGLGNYTVDPALNEQQDNNPGRAWTQDELLAMAFAQPVKFPPGEGYFYSNTNTVLLGQIIEQITGMPVAQAFQTRIFDPSGMTNSSFPDITDASVPEPHPTFYTYGTNVGTIDSNVLSPEVQAGALAGTLQPSDTTGLNPSWAWTAGAAISTAEDLAVFAKALAGGGLISPDLQAQRMASFIPVNPDKPGGPAYGWALAKVGPGYGHTGELPGSNSFMYYDPDRDITVITWASTAPAPNGDPPAVRLGEAVNAALYGTG